MTLSRRTALVALLAPAAARAQQAAPTSFPGARPAPDAAAVQVETLAQGLEHPWGLALLPDRRMLVTERRGRLRMASALGQVSPRMPGVVAEILAEGQGGLLDVVLDPGFARNRVVFLAFAERGPGGTAGTAVARAVLQGEALRDWQVIYRQVPKVTGAMHFGARIVPARDGMLFIVQGDRFAYREQAQDLTSLLGKIVRIRADGSIPPDNPFVGRPGGPGGVRPEIWSYGHRNIQGAALHPETGLLWTAEHGARGGDELNQPQPGRNYGWPEITYGIDYNGRPIGTGTAREGMEQPVHIWDPSIAPSGLAFYTGDAFPAWRGHALVGALAGQHLARLEMRGGRVVAEHRYLTELRERIRDVRVGADGLVYLLTDSPQGRVLRLRPA
jgi:glucose/arabinose dehydrogenase